MIRNVFGKAVTKSTALSLLEYNIKDGSAITSVDLAKVALALKNSQGKGKDEEEALRSVQIVREICGRNQEEEEFCTLGWIYNATGSAITLLDTHNGRGNLAASTLYPVRIENGQWGMFLHEQSCFESSGAVVYEGYNSNYRQICYWCVAWKNRSMSSTPQVHVKIGRDIDWCKNEWNNVYRTLENSGSLHRIKEKGWLSVISASARPNVVFEALLTMDHDHL
ncbi:hypothetical protein IC575_011843 [Cucumis melo]